MENDVLMVPVDQIPEGSVITEEMIATWQERFPDNARDVTIGTLVGFEHGRGELPSDLFDGEKAPVFAPLREAYFNAQK